MISGIVTSEREAFILLVVHGPAGQEEEIAAVIDTGFDGSLSLPSATIARLGLTWRRRGRALLADGSESVFDIHEAVVMWDGRPFRIAVDAADMIPLVGMSLLDGHELTIQIRPNGVVTIKPLP
jgi:clan AA aspartic protease